mgnify:CR=1 FL=1
MKIDLKTTQRATIVIAEKNIRGEKVNMRVMGQEENGIILMLHCLKQAS